MEKYVLYPQIERAVGWFFDSAPGWLQSTPVLILLALVWFVALMGMIVAPIGLAAELGRKVNQKSKKDTQTADSDKSHITCRQILQISAITLVTVVCVVYAVAILLGVVIAVSKIQNTERAELERIQVAVEEARTDAELIDLMVDGRSEVITDIANHPFAGAGTQHRIAAGNYSESIKESLADRSFVLHSAAAIKLGMHDNEDIRLLIAARRDAPETLLAQMLYDEELDVAMAAFRNRDTPLLEKCKIVQEILEGSDDYEHFLNDMGEMVDYCKTISETR